MTAQQISELLGMAKLLDGALRNAVDAASTKKPEISRAWLNTAHGLVVSLAARLPGPAAGDAPPQDPAP